MAKSVGKECFVAMSQGARVAEGECPLPMLDAEEAETLWL